MSKEAIVYRINTATESEIAIHLTGCDNNFVFSLKDKVNINEYAKKIAQNAVTFEAWGNTGLAGIVAAYFNDEKRKSGYITNVSILEDFWGQGVGTALMKKCIEYAMKEEFKEILLEVSPGNNSAISLYKKNDFHQASVKGEMIIMKKILHDAPQNKIGSTL